MDALAQLKEMATRFDEETKKLAPSCKWAYMNVSTRLDNVWGDFTRKQEAIDTLTLWAVAFRQLKGTAKLNKLGKVYRASVEF